MLSARGQDRERDEDREREPHECESGAAALDRERPLGFESRQLAALVAVAKTGSFRIAAERLGYVQSAVSRQIATLEQTAGMRLVERARGTNEVHLTEAGELLLRHAEALLARQAAARADLIQLAAGTTGAVRIGVPQGIGHRLLRSALAAYAQRRPHARVVANEFPSDAPLFGLVEDGVLDLALAGLPLEPGPFECTQLVRVRWVLAVPARWPLARRAGALGLADVADKPVIACHGARSAPSLEARLRAIGCEPNVVFRTDIDDTVRSLVAAGVGAALLPAFSLGEQDAAIRVDPLEDPALTQVVGLFWHRERVLGGAATELRAVVCELCGRLDRSRAD